MKKKILIIADIEGCSACTGRTAAKFLGKGWPLACLGMTRDVNALGTALLDAGVQQVQVLDFHRTGHNIFPDLLHPAIELVQGYKTAPVPGFGAIGSFDGVMMTGMHAPSGTSGFLAHTLTSRIQSVRVKGHPISEAQLFAAVLSHAGIPPLFFSGCPVACAHTRSTIPGIHTLAIDKLAPDFDPNTWRSRLARAAVRALDVQTPVYTGPRTPFDAHVTLDRGKATAKTIAHRWGYACTGKQIIVPARDFTDLFIQLSRLAYLTPLGLRLLPQVLPLYHFMGRAGLAWAKKSAPVS